MDKKIKIAIFGAALGSNNYGCTALGITQISMLQKAAKDLGVPIECRVFEEDTGNILPPLQKYLDTDSIVLKYAVRLKTGIKGFLNLRRDIKDCDFVIDLTYGDSFSDIYGLKTFFLYSIPKYFAIKINKPFILGPQTIGPFAHAAVRGCARYILKRADYVFARDEMSGDLAEEMTGRDDIFVASDLAMELPYDRDMYSFDKSDGKLNVGLNVSQLMWNKNAKNSNLPVNIGYRELIERLLASLKERGARVHLVTHVYDRTPYNEYSLARDIHAKFANTLLAPEFSGPSDAKSYMAHLDVFIGSRMHATIGAFSAGVPVIPISYSRKFEGLYNALGYNHCIDCSKGTVEEALGVILGKLSDLGALKLDAEKALQVALERNLKYKQTLCKILKEV